ncbi:glycogen synthase GlgA [Hydrogenimonas cancrithermarum]|uniref:Glycogen synthase n=1 Tax=Hydrogenimonas cancrithermarum TaxID=2993563 RepID=A0ABM8FHL1_9BACT|nr:glycogen synthase GlgA [Hydrogenimonas cancrithermarum]BDY11745.1 glycogen synthase 1 [Hydrogenimonas cancrithermarum]
MNRPLNILFTASEVVPFAKTGGLADVAGALPKVLAKLGHNVIVVMPRYYSIDKSKLEHIVGPLGVPMGPMGELWAGVYKDTLPGSDVPVYFIDYEKFYGRSGLYADENGFSYPDNDLRFIFLSKAAFQLAKKLAFRPDIIHAHDWHTAAQPALLRTRYAFDEQFEDAASVLTIHNLQHQGHFFKGIMDVMEVGWEHFNPYEFEAMDGVNMLKGGIAHADAVTTVSRKYAHEIQTPEFGFGLDGHIRAHSDKLYGILNGIDYDEWSPAIDPFIKKRYDIDDMSGKALCKRDLQERFGLPVWDDVPLIGFVGRFAEQKGIGLIAGAIEGLMHLNIQIVMLGTGEKWAEGFFSEIARRYPEKFACHVGYSNELAHIIEAGSDLFLMPSLFEPCGLNQIYSLRYGTLPIVRATGGLDDTIHNYDPGTKKGNGFKFYDATTDALYHTVKWATDICRYEPEAFRLMQKQAMEARFDWEKSAEAYEDLYYHSLYAKRVSNYK